MPFLFSFHLWNGVESLQLGELKKVVTVYGGVQVEVSPTGLLVKPSLTHIGKKGGT